MRKSTTKNALLMSVLSLFLCFAMLTGTTFAWFTDTVESGVNQIVAGNLDIELYNALKAGIDDSNRITGDANNDPELFDLPAPNLWEPGAVVYENFTVANEGNLALKYQLSVNIGNATGTKSLAEVLKVAVVENGITTTDRNALIASIADGKWMDFATFVKSGELYPETGRDTATYGIVIWWEPSDIDNNYNMNNGEADLTIDIGVKLFATQLKAEQDSFGPDYDEAAPIISEPVTRPTTAADLELNSSVVEGGLSVDLPAALVDSLPQGVTGMSIAATAPVTGTNTSGEKTLTFSELTVVDQNGKEIDLSNNTEPVTVTLNVEGVYNNGDYVVIYHDDVAIASATVVNYTITYTTAHFCEVVVSGCDKPVNAFVATAEALKAAVAAGGYYILSKDIDLDADETITVSKGVILDLNGYTISSKNTRTATHNFLIDVKGGELTVKNGTVSYEHTGANMGWNGATTVIDVTAGGILNLENAVIENKGGTDMNFAVHLNNWGSVTLNADNCVFDAPYCSVRVFNSGPDMNNVTIENSKMTGATRAFWVHNYVSADFGGKVYSAATAAYDKAVVDARMNFDIFNNNNKFEISGEATSPIRYGFNSTVYYNAEGKQLVTATTLAEVMAYAKNGNVIIDAQGANLGDFNYNGTFGNGTVLKNAKFTYVYGASVDGVATFENCEFVSDHSYSANFSDGSYTGKVIFNDCYFDGWSSFGDAITGVEMNNCTFDWNNPYSMLRFYQNAVLNNCNFIAIDGIDTNKTGTVVKLNNCTGIEGKIYNNGNEVGTWIVDGTDISSTVTSW